MKRFLLIFIVCVPTFSYSQKTDSAGYTGEDRIFAAPVEVMPEFKGGMARFYARLEHIPYLFLDEMNHRHGQAIVLMVVEKDGSVSNVKVIHGISQEQDAAIIKTITRLQRWKPGMQHGKPVRVQFAIPIDFRIVDDL